MTEQKKEGKGANPSSSAKRRANPHQKREHDGKYAFDGHLDRMCVCGHTLGNHAAGSPADCLLYSLPESQRLSLPNGDKPNCGCLKFRLSRKRSSLIETPASLTDIGSNLVSAEDACPRCGERDADKLELPDEEDVHPTKIIAYRKCLTCGYQK